MGVGVGVVGGGGISYRWLYCAKQGPRRTEVLRGAHSFRTRPKKQSGVLSDSTFSVKQQEL